MIYDFIIIINILMVMIQLNIIVISHSETNYCITTRIFYNMDGGLMMRFIKYNESFIFIIY